MTPSTKCDLPTVRKSLFEEYERFSQYRQELDDFAFGGLDFYGERLHLQETIVEQEALIQRLRDSRIPRLNNATLIRSKQASVDTSRRQLQGLDDATAVAGLFNSTPEEVLRVGNYLGDVFGRGFSTPFYNQLTDRNADFWDDFKSYGNQVFAELALELGKTLVLGSFNRLFGAGLPNQFGGSSIDLGGILLGGLSSLAGGVFGSAVGDFFSPGPPAGATYGYGNKGIGGFFSDIGDFFSDAYDSATGKYNQYSVTPQAAYGALGGAAGSQSFQDAVRYNQDFLNQVANSGR